MSVGGLTKREYVGCCEWEQLVPTQDLGACYYRVS